MNSYNSQLLISEGNLTLIILSKQKCERMKRFIYHNYDHLEEGNTEADGIKNPEFASVF